MSLTVAEWHEESQRLRAAGLDGLADFYAANARLVSDGAPPRQTHGRLCPMRERRTRDDSPTKPVR